MAAVVRKPDCVVQSGICLEVITIKCQHTGEERNQDGKNDSQLERDSAVHRFRECLIEDSVKLFNTSIPYPTIFPQVR